MAGLTTELAVCGLHRLGQPLNNQLKDLGAVYVKTCWSSPEYRMYVLPSPKKVIPSHCKATSALPQVQ